jgi:hypothetical protein
MLSPRVASVFDDPTAYLLYLLNQINPNLPLSIDPGTVTFGQPLAVSNGQGNVNTSIELTAVNGQGYRDTATVYYERQDVSAYLTQYTITPVLDPTTFSDWPSFFAAFNSAYGTSFGELETPPNVFPSAPLPNPLPVQIGPRSLFFTGEFTVSLTVPNLQEVVLTTNLRGLVPPLPQQQVSF